MKLLERVWRALRHDILAHIAQRILLVHEQKRGEGIFADNLSHCSVSFLKSIEFVMKVGNEVSKDSNA